METEGWTEFTDEDGNSFQVDEHLSVVGKSCPVPVMRTKRALKTLDHGKVLEVYGDYEASKFEVPYSVDMNRFEILHIHDEADDPIWRIFIRRKG